MKTEKGMWFIGEAAETERRSKAMCEELMVYLELCCEAANKAFKEGQTLCGRQWSYRAQNARRVLVDFEVLPVTSL